MAYPLSSNRRAAMSHRVLKLCGAISCAVARLRASICCPADSRTKTSSVEAETQSLKRSGPIDGLEVWDRARLIFRRLGPAGPGRWTIVEWWEPAEVGLSPAAPESSCEGMTARSPLLRYSPEA
jgi:hypothetical protein